MGPSVGAEATWLPREIPQEEVRQSGGDDRPRAFGFVKAKIEVRVGADEGGGVVGQGFGNNGRGSTPLAECAG